MHTRKIGVDVGNGFSKIHAGPTLEAAFPSVLAPHQGALKFDGFGRNNKFVIEFEGETLAVGWYAYKGGRAQVYDMGSARIGKGNYRKLLASLLALGMNDRSSRQIFMVASIPVRFYTHGYEEAKTNIAGTYHIGFNNRELEYVIEPENLTVVPEGLGSLCSELFDDQAQVQRESLATGRVGVVDIGTRTTDYLLFDTLELIETRSRGEDETGMEMLWTRTQEEIMTRWGRNITSLVDIDQAIHQRWFQDAADQHRIDDIVDDGVRSLSERIIASIDGLWDAGRDVQALLITGGGAELVGPTLVRKYRHAKIVQNPFMANAIGNYRYAKFLLSNEQE